MIKEDKICISPPELNPRIAVLIPFKSWNNRHTRLSGILSPEERTKLSFYELLDSFFIWSLGIGNGDVYIGYNFARADDVLREYLIPITSRALNPEIYSGVFNLQTDDINEGIRNFAEYVSICGYDAMVIAGSDLPLLTKYDVRYFYFLFLLSIHSPPIVIFSRAADGGTPVYLISPPNAYEIELYREGYTNFDNQVERLNNSRIPYLVIGNNDGLCRDLDTPDDFRDIANSTRKPPEIHTPGYQSIAYIKELYKRLR